MSDPGDEDNENDTMMTTRVISAGIMKQTRHTLLLLLLSQDIVSQSLDMFQDVIGEWNRGREGCVVETVAIVLDEG